MSIEDKTLYIVPIVPTDSSTYLSIVVSSDIIKLLTIEQDLFG